VLKKTSAAGSVAIAATAGILFTGSPASAQGLVQGHHRGHHIHVASSNHNRNLNRNRNRVVVRVRIHNRNNNVAVANNRNRSDGGFFRRDGFRRDGFFRNSSCCNRDRFDDDDFDGRRFGRGVDRIRDGGDSVRVGPRDTFIGSRGDGDDFDDD
jgi:hypothetical protein